MTGLGRTVPCAEPVRRHDRAAMALHWMVAALILVDVAYGLTAASGEDGLHMRQLIDTPKSIGLAVIGVVLLQVLWRIGRKSPPLPHRCSRAENRYPRAGRWAAHAAHHAPYLVMLALPLSGSVHDSAWRGAATHSLMLFGVLPFPRVPLPASMNAAGEQLHAVTASAHLYIGHALYVPMPLHILGVLKHRVVDHMSEIAWMLPGAGGGESRA